MNRDRSEYTMLKCTRREEDGEREEPGEGREGKRDMKVMTRGVIESTGTYQLRAR